MSDSEEPAAAPLPTYKELPKGVSGAGSAWSLFGENDELGLMNLQTADRILAATQLPRTGKVFSLSAPMELFDPPFFPSRTPPRHKLLGGHPRGFDDVIDSYYPQGSSQIDSLAHIGPANGVFYGGATREDILAGRRSSIDAWSQKGIVGRGILLDVSDILGMGPGGEPRVNQRVPVTVADLEAARERTGLTFSPGDILLLYTGFVDWYRAQPMQVRRAYAANVLNAGIDQSEEMAEYLWDLHISMIAADNVALEAWPPDESDAAYPFGFMHTVLIGEFGLALGELWDLGALAASCRRDAVHDCLVVSAPIRAHGGAGSPANALALK